MYKKKIDNKLVGFTDKFEKQIRLHFLFGFKSYCLEFKEAKDNCLCLQQKPNTLQQQIPHVKLYG